MARKKNVTFNDIAQYTHFSKTTISRYFNNPDSLTPENQQIISDALDKLNYKENKVAKILANGQTEFVGVLIPSLSMNYYSEMLNQILASYEKYGYKFLVFAGNGHDETDHRYLPVRYVAFRNEYRHHEHKSRNPDSTGRDCKSVRGESRRTY